MAKKHNKSESPVAQAKRNTRHYTVGYVPNGGKPNACPALNIKGRWLHDCGFVTGQQVTVTVENGQLIIQAEIAI